MKLIIAEKNDAARQIAERLSTGKPKKDVALTLRGLAELYHINQKPRRV